MKDKTGLKTNTVTRLALLTSVALVLGFIESLFPLGIAPGVKLGLSNTVLLYALFLIDAKSAFILMALKVGLSGLLFGGVAAMAYSFAGGLASLVVMLLSRRIKGMSIVGVSVAGALAHNLGQVILASFVVESGAIFAYLPVLIVSAAVTGTLTGIAARLVVQTLAKKTDGEKHGEK